MEVMKQGEEGMLQPKAAGMAPLGGAAAVVEASLRGPERPGYFRLLPSPPFPPQMALTPKQGGMEEGIQQIQEEEGMEGGGLAMGV